MLLTIESPVHLITDVTYELVRALAHVITMSQHNEYKNRTGYEHRDLKYVIHIQGGYILCWIEVEPTVYCMTEMS